MRSYSYFLDVPLEFYELGGIKLWRAPWRGWPAVAAAVTAILTVIILGSFHYWPGAGIVFCFIPTAAVYKIAAQPEIEGRGVQWFLLGLAARPFRPRHQVRLRSRREYRRERVSVRIWRPRCD